MVGGVPGDQVFVARVVEPVSQTSVTDPGMRTGTGNRNGSSCYQKEAFAYRVPVPLTVLDV